MTSPIDRNANRRSREAAPRSAQRAQSELRVAVLIRALAVAVAAEEGRLAPLVIDCRPALYFAEQRHVGLVGRDFVTPWHAWIGQRARDTAELRLAHPNQAAVHVHDVILMAGERVEEHRHREAPNYHAADTASLGVRVIALADAVGNAFEARLGYSLASTGAYPESDRNYDKGEQGHARFQDHDPTLTSLSLTR